MKQTKIPQKKLRAKYYLNPETTTILCVSRLSKEKNIDSLLTCLSKLKTQTYQLCLVGSGPEEKNLARKAEALGILNRIHFLGSVDFASMSEIYSLADLFAYPSKTDTQAVVVSEAMSASLPVVAFDAPGPADFILHQKSGFLANSPEEFSTFISKLVTNPQLRKKMSRHASFQSTKYSLKSNIDSLENLFKSLVNSV